MTACIEADPVALVTGRVDRASPGEPALALILSEIRVRGLDGTIGASSPIADDGSWWLILPIGFGRVELDAIDPTTQRVVPGTPREPLEIEVCGAAERVAIPPLTLGPPQCSERSACTEARVERMRCARRPECTEAENQLARCIQDGRSRCRPEDDALSMCLATRPEAACEPLRAALATCRAAPACEPEQRAVTGACVVPCTDVINRERDACATADPGGCVPAGFSFGLLAPRTRVGCDG